MKVHAYALFVVYRDWSSHGTIHPTAEERTKRLRAIAEENQDDDQVIADDADDEALIDLIVAHDHTVELFDNEIEVP